jgi:hypothetical protein
MDDLLIELGVWGCLTLVGIMGMIVSVVDTMVKDHGKS